MLCLACFGSVGLSHRSAPTKAFLRFVTASGNQLETADELSEHDSLLIVDVWDNQLADLSSFSDNTNFRGGQLWAGDNPLACESIEQQLQTLELRAVSVFGACPD